MLSKNQIKHIKSLHQLKYRKKYGEFIAEGDRLVRDLMHSRIFLKEIIATKDWIEIHEDSISPKTNIIEVKPRELKQVSTLSTPQAVMARVKIPSPPLSLNSFEGKLSLALDDISNPGNLGTIIRTADWFGIENILCSNNTVDAFNPKVVQASMGSIARINLHYVDLYTFLSENQSRLQILASSLEGEDIRKVSLPKGGIIVIGNEAHGINKKILFLANQKIFIPSLALSNTSMGPESLNAAIATAIFCYEFRRNDL